MGKKRVETFTTSSKSASQIKNNNIPNEELFEDLLVDLLDDDYELKLEPTNKLQSENPVKFNPSSIKEIPIKSENCESDFERNEVLGGDLSDLDDVIIEGALSRVVDGRVNQFTEEEPSVREPKQELKNLENQVDSEIAQLGTKASKPVLREPLKDLTDFGEYLTTSDRQITGVTLLGGFAQLASLSAILGMESVEEIVKFVDAAKTRGQEERVNSILSQIQKTHQRNEDLSERVQVIVETAQSGELPKELKSFVKSYEEKRELPSAANKVDTQVKQLDDEMPEAINPLAKVANDIGQKIESTVGKLNIEGKSEPLKIPEDITLKEKLDKIEDYLNQLNKRLDRLENIVGNLEKKLESRPQVNQIISNNDRSVISKSEITDRINFDSGEDVAHRLLNYAEAAEKGEGRKPKKAIYIGDLELHIAKKNDKLTVQLATEQELSSITFFATKNSEEEWITTINELNAEDLKLINSLPQNEKDYTQVKTAQKLVKALQKFDSEKFEKTGGTITTKKYEFKLENDELQASLKGSNELVFKATLDNGIPKIEYCIMPTENMQNIIDGINNSEREKSKPIKESVVRPKIKDSEEMQVE